MTLRLLLLLGMVGCTGVETGDSDAETTPEADDSAPD